MLCFISTNNKEKVQITDITNFLHCQIFNTSKLLKMNKCVNMSVKKECDSKNLSEVNTSTGNYIVFEPASDIDIKLEFPFQSLQLLPKVHQVNYEPQEDLIETREVTDDAFAKDFGAVDPLQCKFNCNKMIFQFFKA